MAVDLLAAAASVRAHAEAGPPTTEVGTAGGLGGGRIVSFDGAIGWERFTGDTLENVPELHDRLSSVRTYHQMRNDAQIQGLFLGSTLPMRRYSWFIEPNGAREEVVTKISRDYNLPIRGQEDDPKPRARDRFSWKNHLRHVLLAILYGHMYFEQVGAIGDDGLWHIKKLGVRMPNTIQEILMDVDGGLRGIRQDVMRRVPGSTNGMMWQPIPLIPVDRLVAYIWEQEGGNWGGRSMLRGIYKNYLLKDTVLRVGAINIERAGGVPVVTGPKGATPDDLAALARMARQFRVGEGSGGAIPNGASLDLARAAGGEDAVHFVKLQNEEMGRGWLMMFLNLGQTISGSRNLGGNFIDFALSAQETIADWVCDITNEHMIEDDIDWNYGPDEPAPLVGFTRKDDRQLAVTDLVEMIDRGLIQVDDELESWIREEYQMPRRQVGSTPRTLPTTPKAERRKRAASDSPASPAEPHEEFVDA